MTGIRFALCFLLVVAVQQISGQGCLYEGHTYQQGEKWTKPCEYNCVCDDGSTGHYTCTAICPTYNNLPQGCVMEGPKPGECCGAPKCNFQTQTVAPTGTHTTCVDKLDCTPYGQTVCSDTQYRQWVTDNCAAFCHLCGGGPMIGPGITGGGGPTTGPGITVQCVDKINNCAQYGQTACTDPQFSSWAHENCLKFCNFCGGSGGSGGSGTVAPVIMTAAPGAGTCTDKINGCSQYGQQVCSDPTYTQWVHENCAAFCHLCGGTGHGPGTIVIPLGGTSAPAIGTARPGGAITGTSTGCVFKGTVYTQGQQFLDGCQYKCTCTDASTGMYTCEALCYTFNLPPACSLQPPAAGKCCQTPSCPPGIHIDLPPGYVAN